MKTDQRAPFQFGTLATRENFIDRVQDRAMLRQYMLSHINVMLVSPRRWGKSSLVRKAMAELCEAHADIRVCHIDAFSISSEQEFYRTFASAVIACCSNQVERWVADAKQFLTGVIPQIVVGDQMTNFLAFDLKYEPREQDKLTILQLPETLAKAKGVQVIVCIDEFQQLASLPQYHDMEGKMRSVWQQQESVTYCLYGSKRSMMLHIFGDAASPFYRFGQVMFMPKIAQADWIPFITSSFERTGRHISEQWAARICQTVECHSWYLQQLCYFIWSITAEEVDEQTFDTGLKQVINVNTPMFQSDTDKLTASQVGLLRAVCHGETRLSAESTKQRYHLGNPNTLAKNKRVLQERDILEPAPNGGLALVDPIYRLWLLQTYA